MRKVICILFSVFCVGAVIVGALQHRSNEQLDNELKEYIICSEFDHVEEDLEEFSVELEDGKEQPTEKEDITILIPEDTETIIEQESVDYSKIMLDIKEQSNLASIRYDSNILSSDDLLHNTIASIYMYSEQTADILNSIVTQLANLQSEEVVVYAVINESYTPEVDGYDFVIMNENTYETFKVIYYYNCDEAYGYIVE